MGPEGVIVVGAGIAGLVIARELVLRGWRVRVLEQSPSAGGQLSGEVLDGLRVDTGAAEFSTAESAVGELLERLGRRSSIVAPHDETTWLSARDGAVMPLPSPTLLGIPMAPLAEDVVRIVGRSAAWRAMLDALLPGPIGARSATLGELVRRRMGAGLLEKLVAPVVEGLRGRHPDDLPITEVPGLTHHLLRENSLGRAVMRIRLGSDAPGRVDAEVASIDGGMVSLIDLLLAELDRFGVPVDYGVRVIEAHADHVRVAAASRGDDGREGSADGAVEAEQIDGLVVVAAPGLIGDESAPADEAGCVVTLVLAPSDPLRASLGAAPRGGGVIVAPGSSVHARRLEHLSAAWPHVRAAAGSREVVRVHYAQQPSVERARLDAETLLGVSIPSEAIAASSMRSWMRAARVTSPTGLPVVGEQVVGADLGRVIAHARAVADEIGDAAAARD